MTPRPEPRPREGRTSSKPAARELRRIIVWKEIRDKPLARRKPRGR